MRQYREATLEAASGVDLIVALYDGLVRFLLLAAAACEKGEVEARREAVRRAIDIVIHLQARLRMDIGGAPRRILCVHLCQHPQGFRERFAGSLRCDHRIGSQRSRSMAGGGTGSRRTVRGTSRPADL
jgi:hypothetical protein